MNIQTDKATEQGIAPPSTILVTGGTGFVGAYVIRDLLKEGYKVKAIRRNTALPSFIDAAVFDPVQWIAGDIMDPQGLEEAMENVDAVIHSAAKVSFSHQDRHQVLSTNIEGTANVVNAALEKNVRRLIHVSSVASFGKKQDDSVITEESKWLEDKLNTAYAISKYYGEMEVWRGTAEGLAAVIVNPSTILGYGDWNASSSGLFKTVYDRLPWYTTGATGFVDIEDVSRAIVKLLATNIQSERFILNGDNWSYRKMLDAIADGLGKKRPHIEATPFLAAIAWRLDKWRALIFGKKSMLTKETAHIAQTKTKFDNSKILKALPGFTFNDIEDTIKKASARYAQKQALL